jgi:hypothetical protein
LQEDYYLLDWAAAVGSKHTAVSAAEVMKWLQKLQLAF